MINFFVGGVPAPQGSKTATVINGRAVMFEASKKVEPWRKAVTQTARNYKEDMGFETITSAIEVGLIFYLPKPSTVKRLLPSVKPDLDKLIRSTLDGLTKSEIYKDDALVVAITASKAYAHDKTGCQIFIETEFDV